MISFVIPSLGARKELQNCICSIEKAYEYVLKTDEKIVVEIIIAFNGEVILSDIKCNYPHLIKTIRIKELGASKARNKGIKQGQGDCFVFLDDDATVKEDYLKILLKSLSVHNANVFYARLMNLDDNLPFTSIYKNEKSHYLDRFDYAHSGGTTLAIKKEILEKVGIYDENFGPGAKYPAAEEGDLFFRIIQSGEKILYSSNLVVFHSVTQITSAEKVFNYSYAISAMLMKQAYNDRSHFVIYVIILISNLFKSLFRVLQQFIFPETLREKDNRFRYNSFLLGSIKGIIDYVRFR